MKKAVMRLVIVAAGVAGVRRFAPVLAQRAMQHCHEMLTRPRDELPCEADCCGREPKSEATPALVGSHSG